VREELGAILTNALTSAAAVHIDQPTAFGGESPVVVASNGTMRDGGGKRTFGGPVAPTFYLDVYLFVATVVKDAGGNDVLNDSADDQLDTLEAGVAQVVADYASAQTWTAISCDGRSSTEFVTIIDGWSFANTGSEILIIKNTDTVSKTLTMDVVGTVGGITPADTTVTVPAASAGAPGYAFVHFPVDAFSGTPGADIDNVTGVTAAVIRHP
jgi:hypothetical protein